MDFSQNVVSKKSFSPVGSPSHQKSPVGMNQKTQTKFPFADSDHSSPESPAIVGLHKFCVEKAEITIPVENAQEVDVALASNVQYDETVLDNDDDVYSSDDDEGFDAQGWTDFSKNTALPKIYHLPQLYLEPKKKILLLSKQNVSRNFWNQHFLHM